jgi:hypothetical protein
MEKKGPNISQGDGVESGKLKLQTGAEKTNRTGGAVGEVEPFLLLTS